MLLRLTGKFISNDVNGANSKISKQPGKSQHLPPPPSVSTSRLTLASSFALSVPSNICLAKFGVGMNGCSFGFGVSNVIGLPKKCNWLNLNQGLFDGSNCTTKSHIQSSRVVCEEKDACWPGSVGRYIVNNTLKKKAAL